jgi:CobQ-like glutamine amidotransferase family enzyme
VFDSWTIRKGAASGDQYRTLEDERADRAIGELVVRWEGTLLVGFENHSGGTYLGATARPLGQVLAGHGNNGDGTEGIILGGAIGTNLRGPCLPKNPALADYLIGAALRRRLGETVLTPLEDGLEQAAHAVAVQRARSARRAERARLARTVLRYPGRGSRMSTTLRRGHSRPSVRR